MGAQLLKGSPRGMFAPFWAVDEGFLGTVPGYPLIFVLPPPSSRPTLCREEERVWAVGLEEDPSPEGSTSGRDPRTSSVLPRRDERVQELVSPSKSAGIESPVWFLPAWRNGVWGGGRVWG